MPPRSAPSDLLPWALTALRGSGLSSPSDVALTLLTGDASNRRYFRLSWEDKSYIVAEAPPATEKNREFLAVQTLLANAQVRVPTIVAADIERGYLPAFAGFSLWFTDNLDQRIAEQTWSEPL